MYQDAMTKQEKKLEREERHKKSKLKNSSYMQMLREDLDDRPEEVGRGLVKKTKYQKEMENLEKVEQQNMTRM